MTLKNKDQLAIVMMHLNNIKYECDDLDTAKGIVSELLDSPNTHELPSPWRLPTIHELDRLHTKKWLSRDYVKDVGYNIIWSSTNDGYWVDSNYVSSIHKRGKEFHRDYILSTQSLGNKAYVVAVRVNNDKLEISEISSNKMNYKEALNYIDTCSNFKVSKSVRIKNEKNK